MVQGPSTELIDAIRSPPSLDAQIAALKQLKNDIVGHDLRKALVVKQGVVEPLVDILSSASKSAGKRSVNGVGITQQPPTGYWTQEDEARMQATLILGSVASGGPAFIKPLLVAGAAKQLVAGLGTETSDRLVSATLQALRSLALSTSLGSDSAKQYHLPVGLLQSLLKQPSSLPRLKVVNDIIALSARDEATRHDLALGGLIDTLASLLASHAIANQHVEYRGSTTSLPPAPPFAAIPSIISAIAAIVAGSNFRVQCFILSPPIRDLFANALPDITDQRFIHGPRPGNPSESLLPPLHVPTYKSVSFTEASKAFPALNCLQPADRTAGIALDPSQRVADAEHANAVVGWLIFLARSTKGLSRLTALKLLALVNNAIDEDNILAAPRSESMQRQRERERQMAMLAIPLAVKLMQVPSEDERPPGADEQEIQKIQEQACEVLALLVQGSKDLQTAAAEAGAIKHACSILRKSFEKVPLNRPMWSASTSTDAPESCIMGSRGLPVEIRHVMRSRKSSLEAIAALAKKDDVHRKAIVEAQVVNCIIESLKPLNPELEAGTWLDHKGSQHFTSKDGNTTPVILAACHAAQSISRSVSLLRTSLIDGGMAKPIFELLKHSDLEVQIAATDVCCNLLLEFSPMREDLLTAGVIKTLTEHARQSEMGLRLASLWALKHLVHAASRDVKIQCLEELGSGWLVGAIQGSHLPEPVSPALTGGVSVTAGGLSTPNAAGEQVDLLNPPTSMDVDEPPEEEEEEEEDDFDEDEEEDEDGEVMYDEAVGAHYQASQLRSTLQRGSFNPARYLSTVREMEQNPRLQAIRDDVAVQEQALDFVRNMLNPPEDCAYMVDHLLRHLGQDQVFSLLRDKLAPVTTPIASGARGGKLVYQPTELILSTVHVLTHIANGSPTHKQLLIAQKQLLANWLPHFNHADRRVRVMSIWTINNLTWVEDDSDRMGAVRRVQELRSCGIEGAIRGLVNDADLDVRERVKTAMRQIEAL